MIRLDTPNPPTLLRLTVEVSIFPLPGVGWDFYVSRSIEWLDAGWECTDPLWPGYHEEYAL